MENINQAITWMKDHWVEIAAALSAIHILAKNIVAWTPTPKDNLLLEEIVKKLKWIIGLIGLQPPAKKVISNQ